jgi:arylsulfatase A-like enzyme
MLLRAPAMLNAGTPGQVVTNPVELRDVLPTFPDAASVSIPESIEGRSLLELLRTNGKGWRPYIDLEHDVCYGTANHWSGLTDGRWKYIYHALDGEEQLFHLEDDPGELTDLAGVPEHSPDLKLWRDRLVAHLEERGDRWVRNGRLVPRPESIRLSPNFPGYAPPSV